MAADTLDSGTLLFKFNATKKKKLYQIFMHSYALRMERVQSLPNITILD